MLEFNINLAIFTVIIKIKLQFHCIQKVNLFNTK